MLFFIIFEDKSAVTFEGLLVFINSLFITVTEGTAEQFNIVIELDGSLQLFL